MSVYEYRQNTSGGEWGGPAKYILCEANSREEADRMAEAAGAYFDGCDSGRDCPCCGDRWYRADKADYATVDEAVKALTESRYRHPAWEKEAGGLYVVVRAGFQIERAPTTDTLEPSPEEQPGNKESETGVRNSVENSAK